MEISKSTSLVSKLFMNYIQSDINGFVGFVHLWMENIRKYFRTKNLNDIKSTKC